MTYDPARVSLDQILTVFWDVHDPTLRSTYRGGQYRSAIYFHTGEQRSLALQSKQRWERRLGKPIATEILPASAFYQAEEYHQNYYRKHHMDACSR